MKTTRHLDNSPWPCPDCEGAGKVRIIACPGGNVADIPCRRCSGQGSISADDAARFAWGQMLRQDRLGRGQTQAQAAAELGVTVHDYRMMEQGQP